jgi:hypothetical protein
VLLLCYLLCNNILLCNILLALSILPMRSTFLVYTLCNPLCSSIPYHC